MSRPGKHALRAAAVGLLHAALFTLAFPPFDLWPLVFVALWPLAAIARKAERPARAAAVVWLATLPIWLFHQRWVAAVTLPGYPALCAYLSLYPAAFVWAGAHVRARLQGPVWSGLALAVLWTGFEMLRGQVVFHGYPWFLLGHPLIDTPARGVAAVGGAYLVSLIAAFTGLAASEGLTSKRRAGVVRGVGASGAALSAALFGGLLLLRTAAYEPGAQRSIRIAAVQTNVPQDNKIGWSPEQRVEDFRRFAALTQQAATGDEPPEVLIWPETMFPGVTLAAESVEALREAGIVYDGWLDPTTFNDALLALQSQIEIPMLVGAEALDGVRVEPVEEGGVVLDYDARYNSVFLLRGGEVAPARYDKLHLTPFGEVMPYISWSDWLEERLLAIGAPGMSFDLETGAGPVVFEIGGADGVEARLATPICFEAATPHTCRRLVFAEGERQADLLVNVTNDGWFGSVRGGRAQHLQAARWRCVELATPMIRAANTGISAWIDAQGRLIRTGPDDRQQAAWVDGVMAASPRLPARGARTPYAVVGDLAGWLALGASFLLLIWAAFTPRRGRRTPGT